MDARKRADGRNPEPRTGSPQRGSPRREHRGVPRAGTSGREGRTGAHACRARVMMDLRAGGCYHDGRAMHGITTLQHMPKRAAAALAIALTLAAGVVGGFAARYVHLPLPWLLGALFTTMALSLAGAPVRLIPWGRPAGAGVGGAPTRPHVTPAAGAEPVT